MLNLAVFLNTWQDDDFRAENVDILKKTPALGSFEEFVIGMDVSGVTRWEDEKEFWNRLGKAAGNHAYILCVRAINASISGVTIDAMVKEIISRRYDYLQFDGSEFGHGNNLRYELIRSSALPKLIANGAKLFPDGSIDAFGKCDAACHFPTPEEMISIYSRMMSDGHAEYPRIVNLEGVSACNIRCTMCRFHGQSNEYRRPSVSAMEFDLYKKVIDEIAEYPVKPTLEMCLRGEELLAKDFIEKVRYTKSKGIPIILVTNALLLTRDIAQKILGYGIDHIVISSEGYTPETYNKIMDRGDFTTFRKNVDALFEEKERMNSNVWLTSKLVLQDDNIYEVDGYVEYWKKQPVDAIVMQNLLKTTADGYHKSYYTPRPLPWRIPCRQFFLNTAITTSGEVTPCSVHDQEGADYMVGNVSERSLLDVWRGETMEKFRRAALEERYDDIPFCAKCDGNTCKSVLMARWDEGGWIKSIHHSFVLYLRSDRPAY